MLAGELAQTLGGAVRTAPRLAQRLGTVRPTTEPHHASKQGPVARCESQAQADAGGNSGLVENGTVQLSVLVQNATGDSLEILRRLGEQNGCWTPSRSGTSSPLFPLPGWAAKVNLERRTGGW